MRRIVDIITATIWTILFGLYAYWWHIGTTFNWEYLFLPFFILLLYLWRDCFEE